VTARSADAGEVGAALTELSRAGIAVAEMSLGQPSLDEVFLALTGHPAEQDGADDDDEEEAA
jgi:ABC-2 type transport system ATP-binding protein